MTTLSTAQLIEAMRTVAGIADTEQGREKLNAIANRMEMLVAANADMDLQLNSIRSALNIPVNTSVQAGVIAEISRLNDAVLSLRSELSESVVLANKLRRTAKEHQEENQQLRTGLAAYDGKAIMVAEPIGEIDQDNGSVTWLCDVPAGALVYSLPPAASQLELPSGITMHEARAKWGLRTDAEQQAAFIAWNTCLRETRALHSSISQPYTVPDEQHSDRFEWTYGDWAAHLGGRHQDNDPAKYYEFGSFIAVAEMLRQFGIVQQKSGWNACRAAMLRGGKSPVIPDDWVLVPLAPTPEMTGAAIGCGVTRGMGGSLDVNYSDIYTAMVSAAPQVERKDGDA
ncbi:hypothetical protein [Pectobacterium aquaticum]|uniref:hypothetical protein n=1 Tax=Pectobacterium aquaticum TaxID=2204145 RepID=UPI001677FF6B|nr:hypothetical protein [Pectobacterium aquaticum]